MKNVRTRLLSMLLAFVMFTSALPTYIFAANRSTPATSSSVSSYTGWYQSVRSNWYYFSNGKTITGWKNISGDWYYLEAPKGQMVTGLTSIDGVLYNFDSNGKLMTGWQEIGDSWYYFTSDKARLKNWQQLDNHWYYFDSDGKMQTGWIEQDLTWYYLNDYGAMQTGWQKLGGTWYYLKSSGAMFFGGSFTENNTKYTFNSRGALISSEKLTPARSSNADTSYTVYVSRTGKIHKRSNCSGMKYYTTMTYSQAKAAGYVECKNCY